MSACRSACRPAPVLWDAGRVNDENARDELAVLQDDPVEYATSRVWRGALVSAVLAIALAMAAIGVVIFLVWAAAWLLGVLGVPRLPGPML